MRKKLACTIVVLALVSASPILAETAADFGGPNGGSIRVGSDAQTCASGKDGAIRFTSSTDTWEFCNGSAWVPFDSAGLAGPADCPDIGDLCADGTVFAGYHPITHEHLFIPPTDQGTTSVWKTSNGVDDIATDSAYDGRINTNQVANSTTFPAFKLCKDLGTGGHSDWYLPSEVELYYVWSVHETIEAEGNITNFQDDDYWSSQESSDGSFAFAGLQDFTGGLHYVNNKDVAHRVRCVRR